MFSRKAWAGLCGALLFMLLLTVVGVATGATGAKPWTRAQVQKTIVTKVVVKCPESHIYGLSADQVAKTRAVCNDPQEPKYYRAIVACGITDRCQVKPSITPLRVTEDILALARLEVQWHDLGHRTIFARCVKKTASRFLCGTQLESTQQHPELPVPVDESYRLCVSVTTRGKSFRYGIRYSWTRGMVVNSGLKLPADGCHKLAG